MMNLRACDIAACIGSVQNDLDRYYEARDEYPEDDPEFAFLSNEIRYANRAARRRV